MGLIKTIGYLTIGVGIFYGGMKYERRHSDAEELRKRITVMESIDYKVKSLIEERASNPKKVDDVFKKYEYMR